MGAIRKHLLIEGWRGINHSFALVNQCQILELLAFDDIELSHRDLPYFLPHWNAKTLDAGFNAVDRARIGALTEPGERPVDRIYRAAYPFGGALDAPTLTFMVTECGLSLRDFLPDSRDLRAFTRDRNLIVTPTLWSKERLADLGLEAERIRVIPHGVKSGTFHPLSAQERAANRANLGLPEDAVVFLNLGVSTWNKGVDILLVAFATLRKRHPRARLILKDQRGLYNVSVDRALGEVASAHPGLFDAGTLGAIQVVAGNLSQAELRLLYGIADGYVSPYRAEGFNLPVAEAIACGTPAVVTAGGATDDFCNDDVSIRVDSVPGTRDAPEEGSPIRYCEPRIDALLAAMERFASGSAIDPERFARGRDEFVARMTWRRAAEALHALI